MVADDYIHTYVLASVGPFFFSLVSCNLACACFCMGPYKHQYGCCNQNRSPYSGVLILYRCLLSQFYSIVIYAL